MKKREAFIDFIAAHSSPSSERTLIDTKFAEGIRHVNAYHSGLKRFVVRFYGISTKHLNDYLMWFNFAQHAKEAYGERLGY